LLAQDFCNADVQLSWESESKRHSALEYAINSKHHDMFNLIASNFMLKESGHVTTSAILKRLMPGQLVYCYAYKKYYGATIFYFSHLCNELDFRV